MWKLRSGLTYANVMATIAVFLALGGGAYAVGSSSAADRSPRAPLTKHLTKRYVTAEPIDIGKQGDSAGDMLVSTARVFNSAGNRVGRDEAFCIRTVAAGPFSCHATSLLRDGRIYYAVRGEPDGSARGAITGGTGRYLGAGGSVASPQRGFRAERHFTFRLVFR